jgi:hypothetical protein
MIWRARFDLIKPRYMCTGRCQILARVYREFYHAPNVVREIRNEMYILAEMALNGLGRRNAEWLLFVIFFVPNSC